MRKSILFMIMVCLLGCLLVVGCSKDEQAAPTSNDNPTVEQSNEAANSEGNGDAEVTLEKLFANAREVEGMKYEMVTTIPSMNQVSTAQVWWSGDRIRIEAEAEGMKTITITNSAGETFFYQPDQNMAMKLTTTDDEAEAAADWAESEEDLAGMKIVGNEDYDGYSCVIVEQEEEGAVTRMWMRKDIGMPVKMESTHEGETVTMEFKNIELGQQPDDLFEIPAGVQVVQM